MHPESLISAVHVGVKLCKIHSDLLSTLRVRVLFDPQNVAWIASLSLLLNIVLCCFCLHHFLSGIADDFFFTNPWLPDTSFHCRPPTTCILHEPIVWETDCDTDEDGSSCRSVEDESVEDVFVVE